MTHADGMAWLYFNAAYRRRFGIAAPDWVCTLEMSKNLRLVRVASAVGMPFAPTVLVRNEANSPNSRWGSRHAIYAHPGSPMSGALVTLIDVENQPKGPP